MGTSIKGQGLLNETLKKKINEENQYRGVLEEEKVEKWKTYDYCDSHSNNCRIRDLHFVLLAHYASFSDFCSLLDTNWQRSEGHK